MDFMREVGKTWKLVLAYATMSNGKQDQMAATIKKAVGRLVYRSPTDWWKVYANVVFGNRHRTPENKKYPFELLCGGKNRLKFGESHSFSAIYLIERILELLYVDCRWADRAMRKNKRHPFSNPLFKYSVGSLVLVAHRKATVTKIRGLPFYLNVMDHAELFTEIIQGTFSGRKVVVFTSCCSWSRSLSIQEAFKIRTVIRCSSHWKTWCLVLACIWFTTLFTIFLVMF